MISNDQDLQVTLDRIARLQAQVAHLRRLESNPANYRASAAGFLAEIGVPIATDTVGEFVQGVGGAGFPSPTSPILTRLRLIGRLWEFADSIRCYGKAAIAASTVPKPFAPVQTYLHGQGWGDSDPAALVAAARTAADGSCCMERIRGSATADAEPKRVSALMAAARVNSYFASSAAVCAATASLAEAVPGATRPNASATVSPVSDTSRPVAWSMGLLGLPSTPLPWSFVGSVIVRYPN
jgi:hypothetical protein